MNNYLLEEPILLNCTWVFYTLRQISCIWRGKFVRSHITSLFVGIDLRVSIGFFISCFRTLKSTRTVIHRYLVSSLLLASILFLVGIERTQNKVIFLYMDSSTNKKDIDRSRLLEMFLRKGVLKICSKFVGEHPCRSVISIKLQSSFIEIAFRYGCSPVNFLHIFRAPLPKNTSGGLYLYWPISWERFHLSQFIFFNSFTVISAECWELLK